MGAAQGQLLDLQMLEARSALHPITHQRHRALLTAGRFFRTCGLGSTSTRLGVFPRPNWP